MSSVSRWLNLGSLPRLSHPFIVLLHPMAHKKRPTHRHSQKKSSKASRARDSKPP